MSGRRGAGVAHRACGTQVEPGCAERGETCGLLGISHHVCLSAMKITVKRKRQAQEQRSSFRGTRAPGRKARCALAPCLLRYLLISTWGVNNRQKEPSRVCYSPPAPGFSCQSFHGGAIWVLDAESCPLTGAGCSAWPVGPRWQGACVSAWSGLAPHQPSGPRTSHLSHSGVTRA